MSEVFVHATMTVRFGAEQLLNDSMGQLLPRVAKLGWKLDACYRFVTGPTRIILNVWKIPDANAFTLLPEQIAGDPELAAIMGKIHSCLEANELTLMTPHTYPKPVKSPRQPARSR
ncbi:hypothetical protein ACLESO_17290 [Pyxidicoccus sp. 3LG]